MSNDKKIRFNMEVTQDMNSLMERLAEAAGLSKSELMRRAILLFEAGVQAKRRDERMATIDQNNNVKSLIVGI